MPAPAPVQPPATASSGFRALLPEAACWIAIAAMVLALVRPGGLLGDDEQYLYLVKGFVTGRPFANLHDMDGSPFLLRPFGFPLFLTAFYPLFGQRWEAYPWVSIAACILSGWIVFAWLRPGLGRAWALILALALLANPIIRFWSGSAYSDIPFAFFLLLFFRLHRTGRCANLLPLFAVFLVSLRTSALPLAGAYAAVLAWRREWVRFALFTALLSAYFGFQQWHFGEVPGLQQYFRIHVEDSTHAVALPLPVRMLLNVRSFALTLLPASFLYGAYAWLPASLAKACLGLALGLGVAVLLLLAAGRSALMHLFIGGYVLLMLVMRPEDLVHRILIPLIPLAFLGLGRVVAAARGLGLPRARLAAVALALLAAADGLAAFGSYRKEFEPRGYDPVYRAGERSAMRALPGAPSR